MSYDSEVLADSPWFYCKTDETSGTTLADASGNARPLSIIGGSPSLAQTGPNGAADAILWPDSSGGTEYYAKTAANFASSPATFEAWVYLTASPTHQTAIICQGSSYGGGGNDKYMYIGTDDKVRFYIFNSGQLTVVASNALPHNQWIHCIASVGAAGTKIRTNKVTDGSNANTGSTAANVPVFVHGGGADGTGGNAVNVTDSSPVYIAKQAIYAAQLSDARTDAHYDAMFPPGGTASLTLSGSAAAGVAAAATASLALAGAATLNQLATGTGSLTLGGSTSAAAGTPATANLTLSGTATVVAAGSATAHLDLTGAAEAHRLYGTDTSNAFTGLSMGGRGLVFVTQGVAEPPFALGPQRFEKAIAFPEPTLVKGRPTFVNNVVGKIAQADQVTMNGEDISWFRANAPGDTPILVPGYELTEPFAYGPSDDLVIKRTNSMFERYGQGELSFLFKGARVQYRRTDEDGHVTDYRGIVFAVRPSQREWIAQVVGEFSGRASQILMQHPLVRGVHDLGDLVKFEVRGLGLHLSPHNGPHTGIRYPNFGGMDLQSYLQRLGALSRTKHTQARALMPKVWGQPTWEFREIDDETIDFTIWPDGVRVDLSGLVDDLTQQPNTVFGNGVTPEGLHWSNSKYPGYFQGQPQPYPFSDTSHAFGIGTTDADTDTGTGITTLVFKLAWMDYLDDDLALHLTEYTSDVADAVDQLKEDAGLPQNGTMTYAAWQALWDTDVVSYDPQGARIFPIAQAPHVNAFLYSSNGSIIGRNPDWIPGTVRVDVEHDYGQATKSAAIANGRSEIRLASGHQWAGEIVLNDVGVFAGDLHTYDIDSLTPADMMRPRDIRPGMNGKIMYFDGSSVVVHVAGCKISAADQYGARSVALTVDTGARDVYDLAAGLERNREASRSPYNEWLASNRPNRPVRNMVERDEWFGRYPESVPLRAGHWIETPVIMGQQGQVNQTLLEMTIPTEFCYLVATRQLFEEWMDGHIGNPFTVDGDGNTVFERDPVQDLFDDATILTVQGQGAQPCGYGWHHGYDAAGHRTTAPLTGTVIDRQPWPYATPGGRLPVVWLSIYVEDDCSIKRGRWFSALQDDLT